jgi:hypothetical protein
MATFDAIWAEACTQDSAPPYLLIDAARLPRGAAQLSEAGFGRHECLFAGDLAEELADVGPYLAQLPGLDAAAATIAADYVLTEAAILVRLREPEQDFDELHRHLRKHNIIYDKRGNPLFFRYYDPRALLAAMQTAPEPVLRSLWAPVQVLCIACGDGSVACLQRTGEMFGWRE